MKDSDARSRPLVSPRGLFAVLLSCILVLAIADVVRLVLTYGFGYDTILGLARLFDVNREANVPAWFSSTQLFLASVLCLTIYQDRRIESAAFATHWAVLGFLFLLMSLDEAISVHERVNLVANYRLNMHVVFATPWIIPAGLLCIVVWWMFRGYLKALPAGTRRLVVLSGVLFVTGALALEGIYGVLISGLFGYPVHRGHLHLELLALVEETLEMFGIALFIYAVLDYASFHCRRLAPLLAPPDTSGG